MGFDVKNVEPGSDIEVKIYLPNDENPVKFFKFGPTPDNPVDHLYEFGFDGETGAEFSGNEVVLHLVDGKRGDSDLMVNGIITDPGTPAIRASNDGASSGGGGCSVAIHRTGSGSAGGWLMLSICIAFLGIYRRLYQFDSW